MRSVLVLLGVFLSFNQALCETSLYERLQGRQKIDAVVSDFVDMTLQDDRLRLNSHAKDYMNHCDRQKIKERLALIVCEDSGGPCKAGDARVEMRKTTRQMQFTPSDWEAMNADFLAVMDKFKIAPSEQAELQKILGLARAQAVR